MARSSSFSFYSSSTLLLLQGGFALLLLLLLQPTLSVHIIIIGDSTAADYSGDPSKYPQAGWGMYLADHIQSGSGIDGVLNFAAGGRSSKSYYDEQLWQQVKSKYISAGDYVFIQFGHNDQRPDSTLYTDPYTTFQQYLSIYINDAKAAGARPVLLTPISRAIWQDGTLLQTLGDYPAAMRQLASAKGVPLVDMNAQTTALFNKLGETYTQNNLFMCLPAGKYSNYPNGITDTTHLQEEGAKQVAAIAAQGIASASLPFSAYVV